MAHRVVEPRYKPAIRYHEHLFLDSGIFARRLTTLPSAESEAHQLGGTDRKQGSSDVDQADSDHK